MGWTKYYADGSKYIADDAAVTAGFASWRNSKSAHMIGTSLIHDDFELMIRGYGDYWQSDQYQLVMPFGAPQLCSRRIMKMITAQDKVMQIQFGNCKTIVAFNQPLQQSQAISITADWYSKWLVLEYSVKTRSSHYYLSENKF